MSFDVSLVEPTLSIVSATRHIKSIYDFKWKKDVPNPNLQIATANLEFEKTFPAIQALAQVGQIEIVPISSPILHGYANEIIDENLQIRLNLAGFVNFQSELQKNEKKKAQLVDQLSKLNTKVQGPSYSKTPQSVRDADSQKILSLNSQIELTEASISSLNQIIQSQ